MTKTSDFYQTVDKFPLISKIGNFSRHKVHNCFINLMCPDSKTSIIDVGVTCDEEHDASNLLEKLYPYKENLTCVGMEDATYLETKYTGLKFIHVLPNAPLPFNSNEFDIAYSNAVLEHVGSREMQQAFISELCRVAQQVFIAVPNRFFPIEHHTILPLLHYLPNSLFRAIVRKIGLIFWANEKNLNLFWPFELSSLFPAGIKPKIKFAGLGFGIFKASVVAYHKHE